MELLIEALANGVKTTCSDGVVEWRDGLSRLHRIDGPAVEHKNGDQEWWWCGKVHRFNGPAVIFNVNGATKVEYWINNKKLKFGTPYINWIEDNGMDINNLSEDDKQLILLVWG